MNRPSRTSNSAYATSTSNSAIFVLTENHGEQGILIPDHAGRSLKTVEVLSWRFINLAQILHQVRDGDIPWYPNWSSSDESSRCPTDGPSLPSFVSLLNTIAPPHLTGLSAQSVIGGAHTDKREQDVVDLTDELLVLCFGKFAFPLYPDKTILNRVVSRKRNCRRLTLLRQT